MDPILLRALERILVVLFSGMAIYLGYRLFLAVPPHKDSDGKFTLPGGIEVVMSRVGPGAFFALFGTITLGMSLFYDVEVTTPPSTLTRSDAGAIASHYIGITQAADGADREREQAAITGLLFTLNQFDEQLRPDLSDSAVARINRDLRQVKLRLLRSVWSAEWGDYQGFADWVEFQNASGEAPVPEYTQPARLFHQGRSAP